MGPHVSARARARQIPPPRARDSNGNNGLSSIDLRAPPATRLTRFAPRPPFSQAKKGKSEPAADAFDEPTTRVLKPENQLDVAAVARAVNVEKLQKKLGPKFSDLGGGDPSEHEKLVDEMTTPTEEDITKVLEEEVTRQLTANNPNAPSNIARYSSKERVFSFEPVVDQLVMHFAMDGFLIHQDSDDAKRQIQLEEIEAQVMATWAAGGKPKPKKGEGEEGEEGAGEGEEGGEGEGAADAAEEEPDEPAEPHDDSKELRNQFNFADRASQTVNNPARDRACATEPPATTTFNGSATQWEMYDHYMEDQRRIALQKEMQKKKKPGEEAKSPEEKDGKDAGEGKKKPEVMSGPQMTRAVKVMERMVNQNSFDDLAQDFKYWEDQGDQFREGEGRLLPLWKFQNERAKRRHVTAISWNPEHHDLFAVGYGSFDFVKQMSGLICCYSLKNPSHPEYTFATDSGVMCLDFHPQHSSLLVVGLYDGGVMVFDVRNKGNRPIRQSDVKTGKHTDPVWQVRWREQDAGDKSLSFYSVSSDGRVTLWTMSKSELAHQDVMELKLPAEDAGGSDGGGDDGDDATLGALAGGCCFDFNKQHDHLFVVGTEEGHVHKCSTMYDSQYLETYVGHHMAVYTAKWNTHHPRVFITAGADWTVKIWDHGVAKPAMSFDLNNAVGDVAWSPKSLTSFAAVTSDGKVHVFDLHENKHEPMCEQKITRKAKLTKVAFNPTHPILLVGDDRGCVTSLKLSPNLRKGNNDVERLAAIVDVALKGDM